MAFSKPYLGYIFTLLLSSLPVSLFANTFNWQGPYVGASLGGVLGNSHLSTNAGSVTDTSYFATPADIQSVNNAGSWTKNPRNVIVGIQAGHDWVAKQFVFGAAVDYSTLPLNSSKTITMNYPDNSNQYSLYTFMRTNWLLTLRGRIGYQCQHLLPSLFYLTGGMAMTEMTVRNSFNDTSAFAGSGGNTVSQNQMGWVAGIGAEVAAFTHATFDFEYVYMSMPSIKTTASVANSQSGFGIPVQSMMNSVATKANFHANLFRLGMNYRFDET